MALEGHDLHAHISTNDMHVKHVSWSHREKTCQENGKNIQEPKFWFIFYNKNSIKIWKQNSKILISQILEQNCCVHPSQLSDRSDKNGRSLLDLKKNLTEGPRQMNDGRFSIT